MKAKVVTVIHVPYSLDKGGGGERGLTYLALSSEIIPTCGALFPPRRARPGPGPHRGRTGKMGFFFITLKPRVE